MSDENNTSRSSSDNDSFCTSSSTPHSEVLDGTNNSGGDSDKVAVDHVYPNGNMTYNMKADEVEQIAWATCQYAHNTTQYYHVSYKCCLAGSYICPEPYCKFQSRPRLPRNPPSKKSAMNPLTPKNPWCKIHDKTQLQHIACKVKMTVYMSIKGGDRHVKVKHVGDHSHPKPPLIRPQS